MTRNRLALVVFVALLVLWRMGAFDKQLAGAGLNVHPCGVTAPGLTVCGREYEVLHAQEQWRFEREEAGSWDRGAERSRAVIEAAREANRRARCAEGLGVGC